MTSAHSVQVRSSSQPYLVMRPYGDYEYQLPISAKGILLRGDRVLLVKNPRQEFELPGGKLEVGEDPEQCVIREFHEEVGLVVSSPLVVDCWVYAISPDRHVLVVSYGVIEADGSPEDVRLMNEVSEATWLDQQSLE